MHDEVLARQPKQPKPTGRKEQRKEYNIRSERCAQQLYIREAYEDPHRFPLRVPPLPFAALPFALPLPVALPALASAAAASAPAPRSLSSGLRYTSAARSHCIVAMLAHVDQNNNLHGKPCTTKVHFVF